MRGHDQCEARTSASTTPRCYCEKWTQYIFWSTKSWRTGNDYDIGLCEIKLGDTSKPPKPAARKHFTAVAQRYGAFSDNIEIFAEFVGEGSRPTRVLSELTVLWHAVNELDSSSFRPHPAVGEEGLLGPKEGANVALNKVVNLVSEVFTSVLQRR